MNLTEYIVSSKYGQCRAHLKSAYLCLTGLKPEDERLREAIELVLGAVGRAESAGASSNVIPFPRKEKASG